MEEERDRGAWGERKERDSILKWEQLGYLV